MREDWNSSRKDTEHGTCGGIKNRSWDGVMLMKKININFVKTDRKELSNLIISKTSCPFTKNNSFCCPIIWETSNRTRDTKKRIILYQTVQRRQRFLCTVSIRIERGTINSSQGFPFLSGSIRSDSAHRRRNYTSPYHADSRICIPNRYNIVFRLSGG